MLGAAVAFWRRRSWIAPFREHQFVPWTGMEVSLVLFAYFIFQSIPGILLVVFKVIPESAQPSPLSSDSLYKLHWASIFIMPWYVPAMLLLLWRRSQTKPRHVGLTPWRWREAIALGYVSAAIILPMANGLNYLAYQTVRWTGSEPQEHALQRLAESDISPIAVVLVALQAIVIAPVVEEFVFRGVMLRWLSQRPWGGWLAMAGGIAIGLGNVKSSER